MHSCAMVGACTTHIVQMRYIGEVLAAPAAHRSVRTIGSLRVETGQEYSLEWEGARLKLDVQQLGPEVHLKSGCPYMVIGEVEDVCGETCLRARLARNIEGMDMQLFGQALELHRTFTHQLPA